MSKTISASFDTIDLAELAAKAIKENFHGIKAITIKYQNFPHSGEPRPQEAVFNGAAMAAAPTPMGNYVASGGIAAFPVMGQGEAEEQEDHSRPEIQNSTESRLIVKAREDEIQAISSRLRSMGGREIM